MPDYSAKFIGGWQINVMMRQAMAEPDLLKSAYIRFIDDTSFTAYAGCNTFTGKYNIKGPTIKFTISDSHLRACDTDIEEWLVRLLQERVSYYGIDEKKLYLKDVAYNVVFDCTKE